MLETKEIRTTSIIRSGATMEANIDINKYYVIIEF